MAVQSVRIQAHRSRKSILVPKIPLGGGRSRVLSVLVRAHSLLAFKRFVDTAVTPSCIRLSRLRAWASKNLCTPSHCRRLCVNYIETNPTTHSVVIITTARYRSVLSRFSLILSRVCLWGQPHVSAFYTLCQL